MNSGYGQRVRGRLGFTLSSVSSDRMSAQTHESEPINVVLVEDESAQREALRAELLSVAGISIDASAASFEAAAALAIQPGQWWLLDLGLPDGDGLTLIPGIVDAGARCLVLSVYGDEPRVLAALRAGASGYLVKGEQEVVPALQQANVGHAPLSASVAGYLVSRLRNAAQPGHKGSRSTDADEALRHMLSPREKETLEALGRGYSYREVAELHNVSYHTVGDHVKSVYRKLAVTSKAQAVRRGLRLGLLSLDD